MTAGSPFPGNIIPANLIDQNAVLEVNAGTFPKPNYNNGTQYIASIPQPTDVREDVVRIDHAINSKFQLMGHYLHDTLTAKLFPAVMGRQHLSDGGHGHDQSVLYGGDQADADVFAQPAQRDRIPLQRQQDHPHSHQRCGGTFAQPSGWTATSFFPVGDAATNDMPEIDLQGSPLNVNWSESYYPWKNGYEGFEYRDDLSWTKGRHQLKFGFSLLHDYKNQQLQANTQGTAVFNSSNFSGDSYINFLLGDASSFTQLQYPVRQTLGQQQLRAILQRQLARHSPVDPQHRTPLRRIAARL